MYEVIVPKSAQKAFQKLPQHTKEKCLQIFKELQYTFVPKGHDVKKLKGYQMAFRIRSGRWRIVYEVLKEEKKIIIHDIIMK